MGETKGPLKHSRSRWLGTCSQLVICVVVLVGAVVLLGWFFDVDRLKSLVTGAVSMKVNTALALLASGIALWAGPPNSTPDGRRLLRQILASLVTLTGSLTLGEYLFQVDLGIDQLFFLDSPTAALTVNPGRMAPATALCVIFCGVSLFVLSIHQRLAQTFAYFTLLISLTAVVGYAFSVSSLYTVGAYTAMAIQTAMSFMLLSIGILAAEPTSGFVSVLISDTAGGIVSRSLLATIPISVLSIGAALIFGENRAYYDSRLTLALMATICIVVLVLVIAEVSTRLHRIDLSRERARTELADIKTALEHRVADRTQELERVNASLVAEIAERQRVEEEMRQLSLTDELTGLHNRRSFFLLANQQLRAARRKKVTSLLFFADVDRLKQTNDTYGHEAGDLVIAATAQVLKECFRGTDIVARIGGDEFVILAVDCGQSPAAINAHMQALINELNTSGRCRFPLSLSTGVVSCPPHELIPLEALLASADAMMYSNKQKRRNPLCDVQTT